MAELRFSPEADERLILWEPADDEVVIVHHIVPAP